MAEKTISELIASNEVTFKALNKVDHLKRALAVLTSKR